MTCDVLSSLVNLCFVNLLLLVVLVVTRLLLFQVLLVIVLQLFVLLGYHDLKETERSCQVLQILLDKIKLVNVFIDVVVPVAE